MYLTSNNQRLLILYISEILANNFQYSVHTYTILCRYVPTHNVSTQYTSMVRESVASSLSRGRGLTAS